MIFSTAVLVSSHLRFTIVPLPTEIEPEVGRPRTGKLVGLEKEVHYGRPPFAR